MHRDIRLVPSSNVLMILNNSVSFGSGAAGDWVNCGVCGEWAHLGCDRRGGLAAFKVSDLKLRSTVTVGHIFVV